MKCSEYLLSKFNERMVEIARKMIDTKSFIDPSFGEIPGKRIRYKVASDFEVSAAFERLGGVMEFKEDKFEKDKKIFWTAPEGSLLYDLVGYEEDDSYFLLELKDKREFFLKFNSNFFAVVEELPDSILDKITMLALQNILIQGEFPLLNYKPF